MSLLSAASLTLFVILIILLSVIVIRTQVRGTSDDVTKTTLFLEGVDFKTAEYVLLIHEYNKDTNQAQTWIVDDQSVLLANRDTLVAVPSWASNYLPGERGNRVGLDLYTKNGARIKSVSGPTFKNYELGTVKSAARPVVLESAYLPSDEYLAVLKTLESKPPIVIVNQSVFDPQQPQHQLSVSVPVIHDDIVTKILDQQGEQIIATTTISTETDDTGNVVEYKDYLMCGEIINLKRVFADVQAELSKVNIELTASDIEPRLYSIEYYRE